LAAAFCLLLLTACSGDSNPEPTSTPAAAASATAEPTLAPDPTAVPTQRPIPGSQFPPDQAATLADLLARTAQLRGLEPRAPIESRLIGRQATTDYLVQTLDEGDREFFRLRTEVYSLLTLIPEGTDLVQLQIDLLRGAILGFYDPDVKTLFVLQDLGLMSTVTRLTVVHEIVHALQDQHYDLNAIDLKIRDDWDRLMALTDVIEGDARGVETLFATPSRANDTGFFCDNSGFNVNRNSNIPVAVQREIQAPYSDGACFIQTVEDDLPEGVETIWKDLPRSTEQVLHPDKYVAREEPVAVNLRPLQTAMGSGWRQIATSTFGEFALQNLLLLGVSDRATVQRGAAGWGGDRWALYGHDAGARLLHLETAWDTEAEAREFWEVFRRSLAARSGNAVPADASIPTVSWIQGGKSLLARIDGTKVTLVVSTDPAAAEAAARELGLG
jgi:hypothetical protein